MKLGATCALLGVFLLAVFDSAGGTLISFFKLSYLERFCSRCQLKSALFFGDDANIANDSVGARGDKVGEGSGADSWIFSFFHAA